MAGSFQARILSIAVVDDDDVLLFFFFLLSIVVALLPAAQAAAPHHHTFPSDAVALTTSGLFWSNPQQINFLRSCQQQCRLYPSLFFIAAIYNPLVLEY
jgi:hypothetical protein